MMPRHPALLCLLLMAALLAGCAAPGPDPDRVPIEPLPDDSLERLRDDPRALLERAESADPAMAARLRLQAAMILAERGEGAQSAEILTGVDAALLDSAGQFRFTLLEVRMLLDGNQPEQALALLQELPDARRVSGLDQADQRLASEVRALALAANGQWLAAVRERIRLDGLLDDEQRAANRELLWDLLMQIDAPGEFAARPALAREPELRGWLELAALARSRHPTLENELGAITLWQRRWEDHPGARELPAALARLPEILATRPRQVALLLPLSGPLASAGVAIRDGFMAAHFQARAAGGETPAVLIFDSAEREVTRLYLEAVDQGADLVIGPLARDGVRALAGFEPRDVPVLALNTTGGTATDATLIQFGLIPEEEGEQIAEQAWNDGMRRAMTLTVSEAWADRLLRSFEDRFRRLGGEIVEHRPFATAQEIGDAVAESLLVSESEGRAGDMRRVLAANVEFEPRRRQDLDFVLIAAEPGTARSLKPTLAYHFAGDLPVYASSQVYDGSTDRPVNPDLDGIRFVSMPWRVQPSPLRQRIEETWPEARGSAAPFYAMGVDAWQLQGRLTLLVEERARYHGMTGTLQLGSDGRLSRQLSWAVLHNGRPLSVQRLGTPLARAD